MIGAWLFATLQCVVVGKQETGYLKIECCHGGSHCFVDGAWLCESRRHTSSEMLQAIPRLHSSHNSYPEPLPLHHNHRKIIFSSFCFSSPLVY